MCCNTDYDMCVPCGEECVRMGSWPNWCEARNIPGDSVDNYEYTEIRIAGFVVEIWTWEQPNAQQEWRSRPDLALLLILNGAMLRRNALPPSSGRPNYVSVVSEISGRRECVQYVAVLGTIGPGYLSRCSDSLRVGGFEDRIPGAAAFPHMSRPAPGAHPASYTMGTGSFTWVKFGAYLRPSHPSIVEVIKQFSHTSFLPGLRDLFWGEL